MIINHVHLINIVTNKSNKFTYEDNSSTLTYEFLIDMVLKYEPIVGANNISLQYYDEQKKKWLFVYKNIPARLYSENQLFDATNINGKQKTKGRSYSWEYIEDIPRNLKIRYRIYNQPKISNNTVSQVTNNLAKCSELTKKFQNKFDGDTTDVNIFWAGPYYSDETSKQSCSKHQIENKYLKYSVNYKQPVHNIIETLKKSNKRVHLNINQFNEHSFESKNKFSIVYLVCHLQQYMKKTYKTNQTQQKQDINRPQNNQEQIDMSELLINRSLSTVTQETDQPSLQRNRTSLPEKKSRRKKRKQENQKSSTTMTYQQKVYYYVGEKKNGQMVKITPSTFERMLQDKQIKLLIIHTSSFSQNQHHYNILKNHPKIQNIIILKSNPIYVQKSTIHYLTILFRNILTCQNIRISHQNAVDSVCKKYPKQYVCCCYHDHHEKCNFDSMVQLSKYQALHYRLHYTRCQCEQAYLSLHYCKQKAELAINTFKLKHTPKYSRNKPLFFCCCQKQIEPIQHSIENKFVLKSKGKQDMSFIFKYGEMKGDLDCLAGFENQDKLIGNKTVIVNLLKTFVCTDSTNQKNLMVSNVYGPTGSGKKILTKYFMDLVLRKKIFKNVEIRYFRKFKDLELSEKQGVLYFLIYKPKYEGIFDKSQFTSAINLLKTKIKVIFITQKPLDLGQIGINNPSLKIQPFSDSDCRNYFKSKVHMTQKMKNKVFTFFQLTWKRAWTQIYYPQKFDLKAILSTIAESPYDSTYQIYLKALRQLSPKQLFEYMLFAAIGSYTTDKQQALQKYFKQQKIYCKQLKIEKHHEKAASESTKNNQKVYKQQKNHQSKVQEKIFQVQKLICLPKAKIYSQLIYQRFCYQIKQEQLNTKILYSHIYYLSHLKNSFINLYDITSDDPSSLINQVLKQTIGKQIETIKNYLQINHSDLFQCLKLINFQQILRSALKLVQNFLQYLFLLEATTQPVQQKILQACLWIINYGVVYRKSLRCCNQDEKSNESKSLINLSNISSAQSIIQKQQKQQNIGKNFVNIRKNSTMSDDQQQQRNIGIMRSLSKPNQTYNQFIKDHSQRESQQKHTMMQSLDISSLKKVENPHIQQPRTNTIQEIRKDQKDLIQKHNFLSRQGLLYLLQKFAKKCKLPKLSIIGHGLSIQLLLEQIYKSHHISIQTLNNVDMELKCMHKKFQIIKALPEKQTNLQSFINRFDYDVSIYIILKTTLGGRKSLKKETIREIQQSQQKMNNKKILRNQQSLKMQYDKVILQMCQDKQIYSKMTQKLITYQRYQSKKDKKQAVDLQDQLNIYRTLIQYWDEYYKNLPGKNNKTSKDCYNTVTNLFEKIPHLKDRIISYNMLNFYQNLYQMIQISLNRLRNKMVIVFLASPISQKKNTSKDKFLVNYNSILEDKITASQSQGINSRLARADTVMGDSIMSIKGSVYASQNYVRTDLDLEEDTLNFFTVKMKLNYENIHKLKGLKGCKYLVVCVDVKQSNNSIIIGEKQTGQALYIPRNQLSDLLVDIPSKYLFICLPKQTMLADSLIKTKRKSLVYFNFDCHQRNIESMGLPEYYIIMLISSLKIIKKIETGYQWQEAIALIQKGLKIVKVIQKQEQYEQVLVLQEKSKSSREPNKQTTKSKKYKDNLHMHKSTNYVDNSHKKHKTIKLRKTIMNPQDVKPILKMYSLQSNMSICSFQEQDDSLDIVSVEFKDNMIISNQYLAAIQKILFSDEKNNYKKFSQCFMAKFKHNFEYYLKQRLQCKNFVSISAYSNIFDQIINKDVLYMYYSSQKFVLLIQNYVDTNCKKSINQQLKALFFDNDEIQVTQKGEKIVKTLRTFHADFQNKQSALLVICIGTK